ncbi:helix-turn-helix domain-containing protein [Haladaptatus sp. DYSN1]|uniref:helix-turn-helix domain-containing protein n=1 Tax=unclassified Haladaptatus TaxID=2622732 RepID=UPI0024064CE8|nr:helix-turn-helix domain-containing protein [Haladaptatus sp. DYSN1]
MLRIEFQTIPSGVVDDLKMQFPDIRRIDFENAFFADEGDWIESLLVTSGAEFDPKAAVESLSRAELFHHERVSTEPSDQPTHRLTIVAHEPYPFILGVILREKAIPNRLTLHGDHFDGVVTVKVWDDFRQLADRIQEQFGRFELLSVNQIETAGEPLGSGQLGRVLQNELSQQQLTVLRAAHSMGYFDAPRQASADDIAAELDIAQSTLSERLRLAEKQLFDLFFSPESNSSTADSVDK